ncbi:hypothetical protein VULLAG_LOCUS9016 [Vulpes lagopus]
MFTCCAAFGICFFTWVKRKYKMDFSAPSGGFSAAEMRTKHSCEDRRLRSSILLMTWDNSEPLLAVTPSNGAPEVLWPLAQKQQQPLRTSQINLAVLQSARLSYVIKGYYIGS